MAKSVAKNAVYNGIRTISTMLFPLITYPYVTRVLLADNLGKVDFATSFVSYFTLIAGLGIANYATREGARVRDDRETLSRFSSEVFSINIASTLVAYAVLAIIFVAWPHLHDYGLLIAIQSTTIIGSTIGVEWLYALEEDYGYITLRTLAVQVISAVLLFVLVREPSDYVTYGAIMVFSGVGANVFNFLRSRRYVNLRIVWDFDPKRHLVPAFILFGNTLAMSIYINIDVMLLNVMSGDHAVGLYSLSVKVYRLAKQLLNSIVMVSIPRLSQFCAEEDDTHYHDLLGSIVHGLLITALPALLLLFMLADYVVLIVGGEAFASAAGSLRILSLAMAPAVFAAFAANSVLLPNRGERLILRSTIIGAVVNLVLNLVAIPLWGQDGAALTTLIAEAAVCGSAMWWGRKNCDYRRLVRDQGRTFVTVAMGLCLMAAACVCAERVMGFSLPTFFVAGGSAVALYAAVLLVRKDSLALSLIHRQRA